MSTNILCSVCLQGLKKDDAVYSTSCGHIFHLNCMQQWKSRSSTCPICRAYNPTSIKIYLHFESDSETETKISNLASTLKLQVQQVAKYKEKMAKGEKQVQMLQKEIADKNEMITNLELKFENSLTDEMRKLNPSLIARNEEIRLKEKVAVLETKLEQLKLMLDSEIQTSSQLTVDKLKAEQMLKQLQNDKPAAAKNKKTEKQNYFADSIENLKPNNQKLVKQRLLASGIETNGIVIGGITDQDFAKPLNEIVLQIANVINVPLVNEDISSVFKIENNCVENYNLPRDANTFAVFLRSTMKKTMLLSNKDKLKLSANSKNIYINAYMNLEQSSLLQYAREHLNKAGFKIYFAFNNIMAKKYNSDKFPFAIRNKDHVDSIAVKFNKPKHSESNLNLSIFL